MLSFGMIRTGNWEDLPDTAKFSFYSIHILRIKPEPRPYNREELADKVGLTVKHKDSGNVSLIISASSV